MPNTDPILSPQADRCLAALCRFFNRRLLTAREIADKIDVQPGANTETKRRAVRKLCEELRGAGYTVCAGEEGYWMSRDRTEWTGYLEAQHSKAIFRFVHTRKITEASRDRHAGQGKLFEAGNRLAAFGG